MEFEVPYRAGKYIDLIRDAGANIFDMARNTGESVTSFVTNTRPPGWISGLVGGVGRTALNFADNTAYATGSIAVNLLGNRLVQAGIVATIAFAGINWVRGKMKRGENNLANHHPVNATSRSVINDAQRIMAMAETIKHGGVEALADDPLYNNMGNWRATAQKGGRGFFKGF